MKERQLLPEEHLVDGGYVSGEAIAESARREVKLVGPVRGAKQFTEASEEVKAGAGEKRNAELNPETRGEERVAGGGESGSERSCIGVEQFHLDFERQVAICPAWEAANRWRLEQRTDRGVGGTGQAVIMIEWGQAKWVNCPKAPPSLLQRPRGGRVKISPHYPEIAARRAQQEEGEFWRKYRRRAGIEASLSTVVRGQGGRRRPYRRQGKTRGHYLRVAAAINLKRAIAWEAGQKPKRERVVKMKKIMGMEQATRKGWARGAKARA